jgi:hypothetical protein
MENKKMVGVMVEEMKMKAGVTAVTLAFLLALCVPVVSFAGPAIDTDGDNVFDWFDNCRIASNAAQVDSDGDGCGNACDFDFNQNGVVDIGDFASLVGKFGSTIPPAPAVMDSNANLVIDIGDFATLVGKFGSPPGPSGTTNNTTACP